MNSVTSNRERGGKKSSQDGAGVVRYLGASVRWHVHDGSTPKAVSDLYGRSAKVGDLHGQVRVLMANFGMLIAPGKKSKAGGYRSNRVSGGTIRTRRELLHTIVNDLRASGQKLKTLRNLKPRHVERLVEFWRESGISPGTMGTRLAVLRLLATWIGKSQIVGPTDTYLTPEEIEARGRPEARSWEGEGIAIEELIARVASEDPDVGWVLVLCHGFGLRLTEAMLLNPRFTDGNTLQVWRGTKNGRARSVVLDALGKKLLLQFAHWLGAREALVPDERSLASFKSHYYYVLRKHGITRKRLGVTTHGLRHGWAQRLVAELTAKVDVAGPEPSHRNQTTVKMKGVVLRKIPAGVASAVSSGLGHGRTQVTYTYMKPPEGQSQNQGG